jgi:hypothetical protein
MIKYHVKDFDNIIFQGIEYSLQQQTIHTIQMLKRIIDGSTVTESKQHHHKPFVAKQRHEVREGQTPDSWKQPEKPVFKATVIEKKEGVDSIINKIRVSLNKITEKNYDAQKDTIIGHIDEINTSAEEALAQENRDKIVKIIFDIASSNKFYSEIYAKLFKELLKKYDIFSESVPDLLESYTESVLKIKYVNPKIDPDNYDLYIKKNDLRKATSTFIVNLTKFEIITKKNFITIITNLQNAFFENIDKEQRGNEVEEITENLFILISQGVGLIREEEGFIFDVEPVVQRITSLKVKEHVSFSNRALFKFKDLVDVLQK